MKRDEIIELLDSNNQLSTENFLSIYQDINKDFQEYREIENLSRLQTENRWCILVEWLLRFTELMRKPFSPPIIKCWVETRQNYDKFTKKNVLNLIECLGEAADMLYLAWRDIFYGNWWLEPHKKYPLHKYYVRSLEYLNIIIASFVQKDVKSFIDLHSRIQSLFEITENDKQ